jgi:hypothetical protein
MQETAVIVLNALRLVRLLAPNYLPYRSTSFRELANSLTSQANGVASEQRRLSCVTIKTRKQKNSSETMATKFHVYIRSGAKPKSAPT